MMDELLFLLTLLSALGCGLMAGFFFAFSVCVMDALSRLPAAQAVTAMQTINSGFCPACSAPPFARLSCMAKFIRRTVPVV